MMTKTELAKALDAKLKVHWRNALYSVIQDRLGRVLVVCDNGYCTELAPGEETDCYVVERDSAIDVHANAVYIGI